MTEGCLDETVVGVLRLRERWSQKPQEHPRRPWARTRVSIAIDIRTFLEAAEDFLVLAASYVGNCPIRRGTRNRVTRRGVVTNRANPVHVHVRESRLLGGFLVSEGIVDSYPINPLPLSVHVSFTAVESSKRLFQFAEHGLFRLGDLVAKPQQPTRSFRDYPGSPEKVILQGVLGRVVERFRDRSHVSFPSRGQLDVRLLLEPVLQELVAGVFLFESLLFGCG